MNTVAILGHFAFGTQTLNGQTIKTKIVAEELQRAIGKDEVTLADTSGGWRFLLRLPFTICQLLSNSRNIIIAPAYKAIFLISPILVFLNCFFGKRLHFVTIGGRLPFIANRSSFMRFILSKFNFIYAETELVRRELESCHLHNVVVMPNCKHLNIVQKEDLPTSTTMPLKLCTFSRVSLDKGIAEAIEAVVETNRKLGRKAFALDIYGQIDDPTWFDGLVKSQPEYIRYQGLIPYDKSTATLQSYFILLFPTFYPGECFAGTIIDAMAAGLPVAASDWRSNSELIDEGKTGFIFKVHDIRRLTEILTHAANHPEEIFAMRSNCILRAQELQPANVLKTLLSKL